MKVREYGNQLTIPRALCGLARPCDYPGGNYLYRPADRMESIFVLTTGMVKIGGYGVEGDEIVYDTAGPGAFCGNLKYLGEAGDFEEFARALTPVKVLAFDLTDFKRVLRECGVAQEWFSQLMVSRWSRTERRLFRIASLSPAARLSALVIELDAEVDGARSLLTQSDLANLTGLTRQTVAKLLPTV